MKMFRIRRHSGREGGAWREIPTPQDRDKAMRKYHNLRANMRQGGVEFWQQGVLVLQAWSPRLRTRW